MRSQLVHSANKCLPNRFMLCRMTSIAAKRMTGTNGHFAASINQALGQIAVARKDIQTPAAGTPMDQIDKPADLVLSVIS